MRRLTVLSLPFLVSVPWCHTTFVRTNFVVMAFALILLKSNRTEHFVSSNKSLQRTALKREARLKILEKIDNYKIEKNILLL